MRSADSITGSGISSEKNAAIREIKLEGEFPKGLLNAPFPQLLPNLYQSLHLAGTGELGIDQSAFPIGSFVKLADSTDAEVRKVVAKFVEIPLAQNIWLLAIRTPRHRRRILAYSLFVRLAVLAGIAQSVF